MENMEKAKKSRKSHRGVETKLLNKINQLLKNDPDDIDHKRLEHYSKELTKRRNFEATGEEISQVMIENAEEGDCEKEALEASEIMERISFAQI